MANKAAEDDEKKMKEVKHPSLGKLFITKATQQAYIQSMVEGKKVMLVGVTKAQAEKSKAVVSHNEMIQSLAEVAKDHALDKANIVRYRDAWLRDGNPPF